jgi:hypothetical protein
VYFVSETAQVELKSDPSVSPCREVFVHQAVPRLHAVRRREGEPVPGHVDDAQPPAATAWTTLLAGSNDAFSYFHFLRSSSPNALRMVS